MKYLIGLGNPGKEYEHTRHNIGRLCLLELASACGFSAWEHDTYAQALRSRGALGGEQVELLLPETFMNKSGETLRYLVDKEGATAADFVVLHDEIDVAFGDLKLSRGRGDGGNNGIKSIIAQLGSKDFLRMRIGIASTHWWSGKTCRPPGGAALNRFVLGKFAFFERAKLAGLYEDVQAVLQTLVRSGEASAMNQHNK